MSWSTIIFYRFAKNRQAYQPDEDLERILTRYKTLPEREARSILIQVMCAIRHLHTREYAFSKLMDFVMVSFFRVAPRRRHKRACRNAALTLDRSAVIGGLGIFLFQTEAVGAKTHPDRLVHYQFEPRWVSSSRNI